MHLLLNCTVSLHQFCQFSAMLQMLVITGKKSTFIQPGWSVAIPLYQGKYRVLVPALPHLLLLSPGWSSKNCTEITQNKPSQHRGGSTFICFEEMKCTWRRGTLYDRRGRQQGSRTAFPMHVPSDPGDPNPGGLSEEVRLLEECPAIGSQEENSHHFSVAKENLSFAEGAHSISSALGLQGLYFEPFHHFLKFPQFSMTGIHTRCGSESSSGSPFWFSELVCFGKI